MQDMQKSLTLLFIFYNLSCLVTSAEEIRYDQMKKALDENSLPLVNLIVDITTVGKTNYVPGMIEISDYQRRTDSAVETTKYHCKYGIERGTNL